MAVWGRTSWRANSDRNTHINLCHLFFVSFGHVSLTDTKLKKKVRAWQRHEKMKTDAKASHRDLLVATLQIWRCFNSSSFFYFYSLPPQFWTRCISVLERTISELLLHAPVCRPEMQEMILERICKQKIPL